MSRWADKTKAGLRCLGGSNWIVIAMAVALLACVAIGAFRGTGSPKSYGTALLGPYAPGVTPSEESESGPGLPIAPQLQPTPLPALTDLVTSVAALEKSSGAQLGIALVPVHGPELDASPAWETGSLRTGVAWSTIKVPLAIAALGATNDPESLNSTLDAAISLSDNEAAEKLWSSLGTASEASKALMSELKRGGDPNTQVPTQRLRSGYTTAGQTVWTLADQATYASTLPCSSEASAVLDRMSKITPELRWGLGEIPSTAFKGGWGPDAEGHYLVRQLGTMKLRDGSYVGVALAAQAANGSYEKATELLSSLAHLIDEQASGLGGTC